MQIYYMQASVCCALPTNVESVAYAQVAISSGHTGLLVQALSIQYNNTQIYIQLDIQVSQIYKLAVYLQTFTVEYLHDYWDLRKNHRNF